MRHPRGLGRHARQQIGQVDRTRRRNRSNRLSVAIASDIRVIVMTYRGLRSLNLWETIRSFDWRPYARRLAIVSRARFVLAWRR